MVKASSAAANQFTSTPSTSTEPTASVAPNASASPGCDAARRDRPAQRARHDGVDVGVVPHVERAGGAGADRDAEQRREADHRMHVPRRDQQADQRREHDERHHPRLQQRDVVARTLGESSARARLGERLGKIGAFADQRHCLGNHPRTPHLMRGSVLNWWNGGGEGSVHSSVVAPAPHGLSAAFSLRR